MLEIVAEPLVAGTVLADAFRLERVLGAGGMGVVWAARELATGRDVAVKVLADDRATDRTQQARMLREAAAAMRIDHPNVVKVSAVLETDAGVPFLVMERLTGESLRALLLRAGSLDEEACARIFLPVIDAVVAAHATGIVHRDLKPENVFLLEGGGVKVLDFGIAKRVAPGLVDSAVAHDPSASLTETGAVLGTPHYMAPEQIFGDDDIDARADVWSLGVMLYECLAGKVPTEGEGFGQVLKRITSAAFEPLATLKPALPRRLTATVDRMLSRDRARRPSLESVRFAFDDSAPAPVSAARTGVGSAAIRARVFLVGAAVVLGAAALAWRTQLHTTRAPAAAPPPASSARVPDDSPNYLLMASSDQARRDGPACLRDLEAFDRSPMRTLPLSTDLTGGYGGVRATCMMLVGDCAAARAFYLAWLPLHTPAMDAGLYDAVADQLVATYCKPR